MSFGKRLVLSIAGLFALNCGFHELLNLLAGKPFLSDWHWASQLRSRRLTYSWDSSWRS